MHSFQILLVPVSSSSVCFSVYRPLHYVCARGICCSIYEVKMGFRDNCPRNDVRACNRRYNKYGREVERLTGRRNMKLLIGGVGESFMKLCLHSAFLQFVGSGPNSQHSAYRGAWTTFQHNCIMLRISAIIDDLKVKYLF